MGALELSVEFFWPGFWFCNELLSTLFKLFLFNNWAKLFFIVEFNRAKFSFQALAKSFISILSDLVGLLISSNENSLEVLLTHIENSDMLKKILVIKTIFTFVVSGNDLK